MSARNMVRNLRDTGALGGKSSSLEWRRTVVLIIVALVLGIFVYLGAVLGLPHLMAALEHKPAPVSYARPA